MTSHTPAIDLSHDQQPLPNQPFSSWLRGQTTLFVGQIVAILGIISFLASMIYYVLHLGDKSKFLQPKYLRLVIDYAHVVFIAVFILVLFKVLDDNDRGSYRVRLVYERIFGKHEGNFQDELKTCKDQLKNFKRRFLWFWIGMLVLYVIFACQHSYYLATAGSGETSAHYAGAFSSSEKNGRDGKEESFEFEFDLSFRIGGEAKALTSESGKDKPGKPDPKLLSFEESAKQLAFPILAFAFNNFTLWSIYLCFLVMYISPDEYIPPAEGEKSEGKKSEGEKRYRKYRRNSGIIILGLTLLFPALVYFKRGALTADEWTAYSSIFDALSGVINALVLALLIARLDSKLVGLPSWLISILYSYAAVQPLFLVFELEKPDVLQGVAVFVLFFVFISKIYFFLIIIYALQTGKMLNYLFCVSTLRERTKPSKAPRDGLLLNISKVLGLGAAVYFFLSLIVPGMLPKDPATQNVTTRWVSDFLGPQDWWIKEPAVQNVFIRWVSYFLRPEDWWIDVGQIIAVLAIIVILWLALRRNDYEKDVVAGAAQRIFGEVPEHAHSAVEVKEQLRKFKKYFLCFWFVTLFLYIIFLLDHLQIRFCFDKAGSLAVTSKFSGIILDCGDKYLPSYLTGIARVLPYPFIKFVLATLNIMFIFWCFAVLHTPAFGERAAVRQRLMFNYSRFVILLLIAVFPLLLFLTGGPKWDEGKLSGYATVFNGVTGGLSAIALALLIARMDSSLFGLPRWSIRALFAYAAIQPLFIVFALNVAVLNMVQRSTLAAALLLKICLFLIVVHSLRSGKLTNYLVCFPFLRDRVDSIFENQFEIALARAEHNLYTFSILKKNKAYYSTALRFESRRACDEYVDDLRKWMKDKAPYWPPEQAKGAYRVDQASGTYWVEVRSPLLGYLMCESIPLRSKEEADEMISESREKIPHCKYTRT